MYFYVTPAKRRRQWYFYVLQCTSRNILGTFQKDLRRHHLQKTLAIIMRRCCCGKNEFCSIHTVQCAYIAADPFDFGLSLFCRSWSPDIFKAQSRQPPENIAFIAWECAFFYVVCFVRRPTEKYQFWNISCLNHSKGFDMCDKCRLENNWTDGVLQH